MLTVFFLEGNGRERERAQGDFFFENEESKEMTLWY